MKRPFVSYTITLTLLALPCLSLTETRRAAGFEPSDNRLRAMSDWPAYGHDPGGSRYSPLTQVNRENVKSLRAIWTYRTGDINIKARSAGNAAFEDTPIFVDETLYLSTPFSRVIALDPESGTERWVYDPKVDLFTNYSEVASRGVSTWLDEEMKEGTPGRRRI